MSKLTFVFIGFVAGVAFLVSCGGGSGGSPINEANADVPVINDQMYCYRSGSVVDAVNELSVNDTFDCMKQSTKVNQKFKSLAGIYAESWILISTDTASYIFYK